MSLRNWRVLDFISLPSTFILPVRICRCDQRDFTVKDPDQAQVGIRAVEFDAFDDTASDFYLKFGFRPLLDDPHHLFLPMHEIRKLKLDPI